VVQAGQRRRRPEDAHYALVLAVHRQAGGHPTSKQARLIVKT
jgi:hypothetical protein